MERTRDNVALRVFRWGKRAWSALANRRFTTIAGTLVFFLVMSLMPFFFWLSLLFGIVGAEELFRLELFGWARELFVYLEEHAREAGSGAGILFLATTLWSSTGFFYHLRRSGEIIYDYRREKKGWRVRLSAAAFTAGLLLFFAAAGGLIASASLLVRPLSVWLGRILVYLLLLGLGFLAAWLLNAYVCPYRTRPADTAAGSAITAAAWLVASVAFSVYLCFSEPERLYGALSLVIVFLLWLYWMMICFTAGVIYNRRRMEIRHPEHKKL